jgi:tetratricopeptide (TPR) repeat protein
MESYTVRGVGKTQKPRKAIAVPPAPARTSLSRRFADRVRTENGRRLLLLWAFVFLAYSNSFHAGILFDNVGVLLQDPRIHAVTAHNLASILTEGYWQSNPNSGNYRPLTTLSYLVNYAVLDNGANPTGYHWVNFLLHGVNVSLVFALGTSILATPSLGLALAAVWALHPLLTESVTNIVGRADELAAFGVLAGLWCYMRWISASGRRKWWWLAALVGAQAIGIFSKENAAVLPGILLLYDLTFSDRATPNRTTWRARVPAYAALLLPLAAFFYVWSPMRAHMVVAFSENPLIHADFWTARFTAIKVIGKFLWLFIWPARLSADYSYNAFPLFGWKLANWEDDKTLIALAISVGALVLAVVCRRRWKALSFFIGFFFIAQMPTANLAIIIGSIMGERFVYLPSVGLAGCLVAAIHALGYRLSSRWRPGPRAAWVATGLVCLVCAARTYARNVDWQDDLNLWSSAVEVCPGSARPHMNLGLALASLPGRLPDAIAEYRTALRILPDGEQEHYNLGQALARTPGRAQDAIAEFQAALRIAPDASDAHYNLGLVFEQTDRWPDAISEFQAALRSQPDFAMAHNNLGNALARVPGRQADAMAQWQAAVESDPDLAEAHYNLGNAYAQMPDRRADAIAEYRAALRSQPEFAPAHNNLANALAQTPGRLREAIQEWRLALRIQPNLTQAHVNLGTALAQMPGQVPNAIAELEAAQRIRPDPGVQRMLDQLTKVRQ